MTEINDEGVDHMKQRIYLATKFILPTASKEVILVKSFLERIKTSEKYPLTLIKAGAGYGKSTLVSSYFRKSALNYFWFNITGDDNELFNFIYGLVYAVRIHRDEFGENILNLLEQTENLQNNWRHILNLFITSLWELRKEQDKDLYFVLEDFQRIQDQQDVVEVIIYLLDNLPPGIHVILTSRTLPNNFPWYQWKVKGKALVITEDDLAFSPEEIKRFFTLRAGIKLEPKEVELIEHKTEGWAIALEMLSELSNVDKIKDMEKGVLSNAQDFFSYLASDVLDNQEADIRSFLLGSSVLSYLNEDICRYLLGEEGPANLHKVIEKGLFIHEYGKETYRYHSLFKDFLCHEARKEGYPLHQMHIKAAEYFLQAKHHEEAIEHLLKAEEYVKAAELIVQISQEMLQGSRFNTLRYWFKQLPENIFKEIPWLNIIIGDVHRYTNNFHQAIYYYEKAEKLDSKPSFFIEVLQRKAMVYIETVQPSLAEPLLNQALQLIKKVERKKNENLLTLIAENDLNLAKISEVRELQEMASSWQVELPDSLHARLLLRTGKIKESIDFLEKKYKDKTFREAVPPKAHREIWLILSILYATVGDNNFTAYSYAKHGLQLGIDVGSPFTESVSATRMGHNLMIYGKIDEAIKWYQKAIKLNDELTLPRGKGEPLWGLCMAYGYQGQLQEALRCAEEGRRVCTEARDIWMTCILFLAAGVACFNSAHYDKAQTYIQEGKELAQKSQDTFLYTVGIMWEALCYWRTGNTKQMFTKGTELLENVHKYNYAFLLKNRTLWSTKDKAQLQAFLWDYAELISESKLDDSIITPFLIGNKPDYHPGYSLRFTSFGEFTVARGDEIIKDEEWTRDKARKLLMILLVYRGKYVRYEQLIDMLWPDKTQEQGKQNLKVTVNTLHRILEPNRKGHQPFFVKRSTFGYGLIDTDNIVVDVDLFLELLQVGLTFVETKPGLAIDILENALGLFKGEFLPEAAYEDWVIGERERLTNLFLESGEKLAQMYLQSKNSTQCLETCERIISYDCCREEAYRLMISCYLQLKQKTLAVQAYHRCKDNLAKHLSIRPSRELYSLLKNNISGL